MDNNKIKTIVAELTAKGLSLSDIQRILVNDYKLQITFLDLRILASELENIDWDANSKNKKEEEAAAAKAVAETANEADPSEEDSTIEPEAEAADSELSQNQENTGTTVVELSKLVRPGAVANGSVKFASGVTAEWILDQYGRLGLDKPTGKPDQNDIAEFQKELQRILSHMA